MLKLHLLAAGIHWRYAQPILKLKWQRLCNHVRSHACPRSGSFLEAGHDATA